MTSNVKLLPLPEPKMDAAEGGLDWTDDEMADYALANVEHHTAAQAAEIEALREQADKFKWQVRDTCVRAEKAEARVERLAEALWLAMDWNWLDEDARPSRTAEICDAALDPTAAQEVGRD